MRSGALSALYLSEATAGKSTEECRDCTFNAVVAGSSPVRLTILLKNTCAGFG